MDILSELRRVYKEEWWHRNRISDEELDLYHSRLISQDNLIYIWDNGLAAYIEFWKVNKNQMKEIIGNNRWSPIDNNVTSGDMAYVANIWVSPEYRGNKKFKVSLKNLFFHKANTKKLVWERNRLNQSLKLFTYGGNNGQRKNHNYN